MENKEIKISRKVLCSTTDGIRYVEMMYPENWSIDIKTEKERYGGLLYPYVFRITLKAPDDQRAVSYFSPRIYKDDHLIDYQNNQIDDHGNLLHGFTKIDDYLKMWAESDLKGRENLKRIEVTEFPETAKQQEERKIKAAVECKKEGCILHDHYYNKALAAYSYTFNGGEWVRAYTGVIEAGHVVGYKTMEIGAFATLEASMKDKLKDYLPKRPQQDGSFTYPLVDEIRWSVGGLFTLDCRLEDYKDACREVFVPIINEGATICDDIWKDFAMIRKQNADNTRFVDSEELEKKK